jgi:hypothetical protein
MCQRAARDSPEVAVSKESEYTPSPEAIELVARAIEEQICSRYQWTPEQFDIWWTKDPRNRNKDERRQQAEHALKALNAAGYDVAETAVPPKMAR